MKPRKKRFRHCPRCGKTNPAGTFKVTEGGSHWASEGGTERMCPSCGTLGITQDFPMVAPR